MENQELGEKLLHINNRLIEADRLRNLLNYHHYDVSLEEVLGRKLSKKVNKKLSAYADKMVANAQEMLSIMANR